MVAKITISPEVLFHQLDDEAVLLHLPTERYFSLNPVGAKVWQLLERGLLLDASVEEIVKEYQMPTDVVRRDVAELIAQLTERQLIQVED